MSPIRCALMVVTSTALLTAGAGVTPLSGDTDAEFERLMEENPSQRAAIEGIDTAIADDPELEESIVAYQDSLSQSPAFAEQESLFHAAVAEDTLLAERLMELEHVAAGDSDAAQQLASFDSLVASDEDLAEIVREVERLASEDTALLETHGTAMAYLEAHPEIAESVFVDPDGPSYDGSDPAVAGYASYLAVQRPLYRAWRRLYRYVGAHPRAAAGLHAHWRWFETRSALWRAWWRCRLRAARKPALHRVIWRRRLVLGRSPRLCRWLWGHRFVLARRPAFRRHLTFLHRHPRIWDGLVRHRHFVRRPAGRPKTPPGRRPKPGAKPGPKPRPQPPGRP